MNKYIPRVVSRCELQGQLLAYSWAWTICCLLIPVAFAEDWPTGRGDAAGTGAISESIGDNLELLWEFEVKGLGFDAGPIVADGKVFANDADGRVIALSLEDGKELWRLELGTGFVASPAYRAGTLYVGDYDGDLRALDAETGEERWKFPAEMEIDGSPNFFESSVLVTSQAGSLFAVNSEDGQLMWKYETGDQLQCGATIADGRTFLGGCDGKLHVVDVKTGKAIGEPVSIDGPTGSTPSYSNGIVYVPTYGGEIFAFTQPSNEIAFRFKDEKLSSEFKNSVAVASGMLVAAGRNKRIFALDAATGKLQWEQTLRKRCDASPSIAGNRVVVAAADGRIISFDLMSGEQKWLFEVKGSFLGSPAISQGRVVVANDRGTVFCFGEKP